VGYADWKVEKLGGYYEGDDSCSQVEVKVPFYSPPELKAVMHTLHAVAYHWMNIPRWRFAHEADESGSDSEVPRPKGRVVRPRLVVETVVPPPVPEKVQPGWLFGTKKDEQAARSKRIARDWCASPGGKRAVGKLVEALDQKSPLGVTSFDVATVDGGTSDEKIEVKSPGGSCVLRCKRNIYNALVAGVALSSRDAATLISAMAAKPAVVERFVSSVLFDNWGPPWLCVFRTFAQEEVLHYVARKGYMSVAIALTTDLYMRFRNEVIKVVKESNVVKTALEEFLGKAPSLRKLVKRYKSGRYRTAQSEDFERRVAEIQDLYDVMLLSFEGVGWYIPKGVTASQRGLPLANSRVRGVVGARLERAPAGLGSIAEYG